MRPLRLSCLSRGRSTLTLPPQLPPWAEVITSPLQSQVWQVLLQDHPDRLLVDYVPSGIREGFHIGFNYTSSFCHTAQRNMFSSREHPPIVSQYLASECHLKWMHGPFLSPSNIHTSPIGISSHVYRYISNVQSSGLVTK